MNRRAAVMGVVALLALAAATPALAAKFNSTLTIHFKAGNTFYGKVKSAKDGCEPHRKVTLYRRDKGPDPVIATDHTNSLGKWSYTSSLKLVNRPYYAIVDSRQIGAGKCKGAQSNDLSLN